MELYRRIEVSLIKSVREKGKRVSISTEFSLQALDTPTIDENTSRQLWDATIWYGDKFLIKCKEFSADKIANVVRVKVENSGEGFKEIDLELISKCIGRINKQVRGRICMNQRHGNDSLLGSW